MRKTMFKWVVLAVSALFLSSSFAMHHNVTTSAAKAKATQCVKGKTCKCAKGQCKKAKKKYSKKAKVKKAKAHEAVKDAAVAN